MKCPKCSAEMRDYGIYTKQGEYRPTAYCCTKCPHIVPVREEKQEEGE